METAQNKDPTSDLKEIANAAREEMDNFLGDDETVSGKFDKALGAADDRSISRANIDYSHSVDHIAKASSYTGAKEFNFQNKFLILFGTILSLALLVPITTYITIFDLKNIIGGFSEIYNEFTFTIIFVIGTIATIIVGLTEFLFLGQFNKKNRATKKVEAFILYSLLLMQFGSHVYFAYLITGVQNTSKKEVIMESESSTEGIKTNAIKENVNSIDLQIDSLENELKSLEETYKLETEKKTNYEKSWARLNALPHPTRTQVKQRRNFYTLKRDCQRTLDGITEKKQKVLDAISALSKEKRDVTLSLVSISENLDKELEESGFWRIIYIVILLILFEGLSHINWLAYYRIIKNAPADLVEDYRELSHVLNWGDTFAQKTKEAIAVIAGQQVRMADEQLNNVKMTSKAFEYQTAGSAALMIENTRSNVATTQTSIEAMKQNTKSVILLAQNIKKNGFVENLGYEPREDNKTVSASSAFKKPSQYLSSALDWLCEEFEPLSKPNLQLELGKSGGYYDPLMDTITIGDDEKEKLTVLAHEFCHHLGYVSHSREFRELEESIIKGLESWLKSQQKP